MPVASLPPHRRVPKTPARVRGARRALARLTALCAAVIVGAGMLAVPAQAEPTVEEIEAQIEKQWRQLEPTIEQYNKVRSELRVNRKKSDDLAKKIEPLQLESELALNRIGELASRYYIIGPSYELGAVLVNSRPGQLGEQLTLLDRVATEQRRQIEDVLAVQARFNTQKEKLDTLVTTQVKQEKDLANRRKKIEGEIKTLRASMPKTTVQTANCPTINGVVNAAARTAIRTACAQIGKPYVFGSTGPNSFDCSGLTQYAYRAAGISLTHFTGAQWNEGRAIPRNEARPGDLVFFRSDLSHVGIYLGNDKMVHAARAGVPVNVSSINTMPVAGFRRPG
ncbi:NlpC/P60 family protein [Micromonospora sp. NPDC000207]|uniref:C40 family peptidase n=1 Tax=Micromonospora sp. NPDC000207 TaxID=3154246 RepID=UPI00331D2A01